MKYLLFITIICISLTNSIYSQETNRINLVEKEGKMYEKSEKKPFSGEAYTYYETKEKETCEKYKKGKLISVTNWYQSGNLKEKILYKKGNENGIATGWFETGEKYYEGAYKKGEKKGTWIWFNKDGTEKRSTKF